MIEFTITAHYKNDILIGILKPNNPELLENISNELIMNLPKEKIKEKQFFSLSVIIKGILGNPTPKTKRQKLIHKILDEFEFEILWNEFTKEILKCDEDNQYKALSLFNNLLKEKIISFEVIEKITLEDIKNKNTEHNINKNNITTIFRNGNVLFPEYSYISKKMKK